MAYPYSFVQKIGNVGVGAEGMALLPFQDLPLVNGFMNPRYMARASLNPISGAAVKMTQQGPSYSLIGNGRGFQGTMDLQALAEMMGAK